MTIILCASPERLPAAADGAIRALDRVGSAVSRPLAPASDALAALAIEPGPDLEPEQARAILRAHFAADPVDWCVRAETAPPPGLLVCDMDSTIIGCECIDEIADLVGVKPQVASITEAAMRGELAFEASLRERVALLAGVRVADLDTVWRERVRLNPGARSLVRTVSAAGGRTALVSGGFTYFSHRVAEAAGFHSHHANQLLDDGDALTGLVAEPPLGREAKRETLERLRAASGVAPQAVMAIGDGANDLAMMAAAGLAVAYRAKPAVEARADGRIATGDLRAALYFAGLTPPFASDG